MSRWLRNSALPTAALAAVLVLSGCQPEDVTPGLWLSGEVVAENVDDWSFTDEVQEIFIQTPTWYVVPHSTTIWCVAMDGALFIGSYGSENGNEKKRWEKNIARNPHARLRIRDKLYDVTVNSVSDRLTVAALDLRYRDKYNMQEVFGEDVPAWWYYQVTQRQ